MHNAQDFSTLQRLGWPWEGQPEDAHWSRLQRQHSSATFARVVEQHRTGYVLADAPDHTFPGTAPPEWRKRRFPSQQRATVGDWVLQQNGQILLVLPRRTVIKRAAAGEHYQQQLIATNIDAVLVVCGLDGDFNPRRIERYVLLVTNSGAQPVIVLTKQDLNIVPIATAIGALTAIQAQGVAIKTLNTHSWEEVTVELAPWLSPGHTVALVGSSGAGKSTLVNTLLGERRMKTHAVRRSDSRGRHTTTHRALVPLPTGACLIDTPGMRELKPTGEESLDNAGFPDIEQLAAHCRFRNCRHQAEPDCAVRTAVEQGTLSAARLIHYRKLSTELSGAAGALAERASMPGARTNPARVSRRRTCSPDDETDLDD